MSDDLAEPFAVPDTFVCDLSRVDRLGANRRLVFTVPDGRLNLVVVRLIVPADAMLTIANVIGCDGRKAPQLTCALSSMEVDAKAN